MGGRKLVTSVWPKIILRKLPIFQVQGMFSQGHFDSQCLRSCATPAKSMDTKAFLVRKGPSNKTQMKVRTLIAHMPKLWTRTLTLAPTKKANSELIDEMRKRHSYGERRPKC